MYYVNPFAGHIANFIFAVAAIFFALMAVTNAANHKGRRFLLAIFLTSLCLFLASSFSTEVSNPLLSDTLRSQVFRKEMLHEGILCTVAAIIYYGFRIRPQQSRPNRLKGQSAETPRDTQ